MTGIAVVAGALANKCANGGEAWVRLSWIRGLQRLGFKVFFVEEISSGHCVGVDGRPAEFASSVNLAYFEEITRHYGLAGSAALICDRGVNVAGAALSDVQAWLETADLLVNISGNLTSPDFLRPVRCKAFVDLDPGFTQLWHAQGTTNNEWLDHHDFFFTVGENIGTPACTIPTLGVRWLPTRQPVVLEDWPALDAREDLLFTTIATWRGPYGPITDGKHVYGLKVHEFRKFIELPALSGLAFELALSIDPADGGDLDNLRRAGWWVRSGSEVSRTPWEFQSYVQRSGAEFSCAQGVYVATSTGWMSDRTVRYLASSRPAVVQDTGIHKSVDAGEGLLTFATIDEALKATNEVATDYGRHSAAARAHAENAFASDKVLGRFLEDVGVAP
jgi:hypothetical protein